jgi:magnesium transporter
MTLRAMGSRASLLKLRKSGSNMAENFTEATEVKNGLPEAAVGNATPRDPEDAQRALDRVQFMLRRADRVESQARRQNQGGQEERQQIVENLVHQQNEAELRHLLDHLHPADAAYILEALPLVDRQSVWQHIKSEQCLIDSGEVLLELSDSVRESLIATMDTDELVSAAEDLDADELADLAPDLPQEVINELQQGLSIEEREQLRAAMSYPEDSVGARMDFEILTIRDDVSLEVVLRYLRRFDALPEQTDQVFVVDRDESLKGSLPLDRLLLNEPDTLVVDVMRTDLLTLQPHDDAGEAAQAFERYDLVSAPVVDRLGKLIGRLTVNEVVDVIREESDEQALSKAGLREEEDVFAPLKDSIRNRAPWLMLNLVTASVAAYVASRFEGTVGHIVILAFLMSIIAGIGGNSGNQTMTLIIRAIALNRISSGSLRTLIVKELSVSLTIGLLGGFVAGGFAYAISGRIALWPVMACAMILNMLVGATVGMLVPILRDRFGKDPAIGSSVLLTFATDTLGFFIFLGLATIFLV